MCYIIFLGRILIYAHKSVQYTLKVLKTSMYSHLQLKRQNKNKNYKCASYLPSSLLNKMEIINIFITLGGKLKIIVLGRSKLKFTHFYDKVLLIYRSEVNFYLRPTPSLSLLYFP